MALRSAAACLELPVALDLGALLFPVAVGGHWSYRPAWRCAWMGTGPRWCIQRKCTCAYGPLQENGPWPRDLGCEVPIWRCSPLGTPWRVTRKCLSAQGRPARACRRLDIDRWDVKPGACSKAKKDICRHQSKPRTFGHLFDFNIFSLLMKIITCNWNTPGQAFSLFSNNFVDRSSSGSYRSHPPTAAQHLTPDHGPL